MITPILAVLTSTMPVAPPEAMAPDWIHFYGGMRLRIEDTMDQNAAGDDRIRGRMRVRLGAKFDITEELKAELRLSTTSGSTSNNPYHDFGGNSPTGDTLGGSGIVFDRINVAWTPMDGTTIVAGQMGNPLVQNPVFGEWLLDDDVQPMGVAGIWGMDGDLDFDVRAAYFVVDEVNSLPGDTADPAISIFQVNLGGETDDIDWNFNNGFWNYSNEGPADYFIWDSILSASMDELTASVEFVQNLNDDTGDDTGYAVGFKYGGGSEGQSQFFGSYMDFDQNATNFGVAQDDMPTGPVGTGLTGFIAGWKYWWSDNVTFRLWALQADNDTDDPLRLRFDIDVKLMH